MGTSGVDALARQQQLHRVLPIDALGQANRAHDRRHADAHLREAELGTFARDDEVTPRHERQPIPEAIAVDRGDHRLEDLPTALERVHCRLLPERTRELAGRTRPVLQVGADAERPARPGHDCDPRLFVVTEPRERIVQVGAELAVHGVQRVGTVVGDRRDVISDVVAHGVIHNEAHPLPDRAQEPSLPRRRAATRIRTTRRRHRRRSRRGQLRSRRAPRPAPRTTAAACSPHE